jgi:glyoxylase-like metal-dependent hydrolase (beta-lactamase superfamily II)
MIIHHLNCGTLRAPFVNVDSIIYCLLVETNEGLVLVDSGFGMRDYINPSLKMRFFLQYMGVPRKEEETAYFQVQALGYDVNDVRHIIQTHLHIDHAGGLSDFPWADVHVFSPEYLAAMNPRELMEFAYVQYHWQHDPKWILHELNDHKWFGLDSIPIINTPEVDFLLIPLAGHTRGHSGVAIGKPGNWLLHCGDAVSPYHKDTYLKNRGESAHVLNFLGEKIAQFAVGDHVPRLRRLIEEYGDEIQTISAHDIFSFLEYNSP